MDEEKSEVPRTWRKRLYDWFIYLCCFLVVCMMIAHMGDVGHGIERRIGQAWDWSFAAVERQINAA